AFELLAAFALVLVPDREREREPAARDLVERIREERRVLRLLGELAVERGVRRELDRKRVSLEIGRAGFTEHGRDRDRPLRDGGRSRSRASSVTGSDSGTSPMCCTSSRWRRCSIRSLTSRPRSFPCSESSSTNVSAPAVSRSMTRSQRRKRASSSTVPRSWSTAWTVTLPSVAEESWSSVEVASRNDPRAARATSEGACGGA